MDHHRIHCGMPQESLDHIDRCVVIEMFGGKTRRQSCGRNSSTVPSDLRAAAPRETTLSRALIILREIALGYPAPWSRYGARESTLLS